MSSNSRSHTQIITREISNTILNRSENENIEYSNQNIHNSNLTENADNKACSQSIKESSEILFHSSNCFNDIIGLTRDSREEEPFYSVSNMDWNIEDFFTY